MPQTSESGLAAHARSSRLAGRSRMVASKGSFLRWRRAPAGRFVGCCFLSHVAAVLLTRAVAATHGLQADVGCDHTLEPGPSVDLAHGAHRTPHGEIDALIGAQSRLACRSRCFASGCCSGRGDLEDAIGMHIGNHCVAIFGRRDLELTVNVTVP